MISNYRVIKNNGEDNLILYLNFNYEFGGKGHKKQGLQGVIREYIRDNKINFHGGIITFVVGGIMIGNVIFNNNEFRDYKPIDNYISDSIVEKIEFDENKPVLEKEIAIDEIKKEEKKVEKKEVGRKVINNNNVNTNSSNNDTNNKETIKEEEILDNKTYINLQKKDGSVIKIELEEYLVGVVGAEMPALFNSEALKAQAIIARTYALKANSKGRTLRDNESNQSYKTNSELKSMWGGNYQTYFNKVKKAVNETEGMVLTYNGNYIEAVYHSTSNGVTESSVNVWGNYYPYLVSVSSQYDNLNVSFIKNIEISYQEISNKLGFNINKDTNIELNGKTSGNRVESVKIEDHVYKGIDFRNILGLRSADFDIEYTDNGIVFTTRGYGHGVGLSQYGANGMAKNGYNYEAILKHYYPGVRLTKN